MTITHNLNLSGVASGAADSAVITSPVGGVQVNTADLYTPFPLPWPRRSWCKTPVP